MQGIESDSVQLCTTKTRTESVGSLLDKAKQLYKKGKLEHGPCEAGGSPSLSNF